MLLKGSAKIFDAVKTAFFGNGADFFFGTRQLRSRNFKPVGYKIVYGRQMQIFVKEIQCGAFTDAGLIVVLFVLMNPDYFLKAAQEE